MDEDTWLGANQCAKIIWITGEDDSRIPDHSFGGNQRIHRQIRAPRCGKQASRHTRSYLCDRRDHINRLEDTIHRRIPRSTARGLRNHDCRDYDKGTLPNGPFDESARSDILCSKGNNSAAVKY